VNQTEGVKFSGITNGLPGSNKLTTVVPAMLGLANNNPVAPTVDEIRNPLLDISLFIKPHP
jgi:hypothetical protein